MEGISYSTYWFYFETEKKNPIVQTLTPVQISFQLVIPCAVNQSLLHWIKPRFRIHLSMEENTLVSIKVELRSSLQNIKVKNSKVF